MKEINSQEEIKGSNSSSGAHLEEISVRFETDGYQRSAKVLESSTRRRRPVSTSASSSNDTAVVLSAKEEEQVRTVEEKVIEEEKNNQVFLEVTDSCGLI